MAGPDALPTDERLAALFEGLRAEGRTVDLRQLSDGLQVLREAREAGVTAEECAWLLTPIFAKTPADQEIIRTRLLGTAPAARPGSQRGDRPGDRTAADPRPNRSGGLPRLRRGLAIVAGVIAIAGLAYAIWTFWPSPAPPTPDPRPVGDTVPMEKQVTVTDPGYGLWTLLLGLAGPALLAGWVAWLRLRKRGRPGEEPDEAALDRLDLGARPIAAPLFDRPGLQAVARQWRRFRHLATDDLDPERTIAATIRNGGLFTPVFGTRPVSPQYVMLIEEQSRHDHVARLMDNLAGRLLDEGVGIRRYYYDDSLRMVREREADRAPFLDLADVPVDGRETVVVVGSGAALFASHTADLEPATEAILERWDRRAFLSTRPVPDWSDRELALLDADFALGTARESGVAALGRHISSGFPGHRPLLEGALASAEPRRVRPVDPPPERSLDDLLADLRARLAEARAKPSPAIDPGVLEGIDDLLSRGETPEALDRLARLGGEAPALNFPRLLASIWLRLGGLPPPPPAALPESPTRPRAEPPAPAYETATEGFGLELRPEELIINRGKLRAFLERLAESPGRGQGLHVRGPAGSGKSYTAEIARILLGDRMQVTRLEIPPGARVEDLARDLERQVGLGGDTLARPAGVSGRERGRAILHAAREPGVIVADSGPEAITADIAEFLSALTPRFALIVADAGSNALLDHDAGTFDLETLDVFAPDDIIDVALQALGRRNVPPPPDLREIVHREYEAIRADTPPEAANWRLAEFTRRLLTELVRGPA